MEKVPSEQLESLLEFYDPKLLHELAQKHIYPFLDNLPPEHRSALIDSIRRGQEEYEVIGLIDFERRSNKLSEQFKALKAHVDKDWHDGHYDQGKMMECMVKELSTWISILWSVGVEKGRELALVQKCIMWCFRFYGKLDSTRSRNEFITSDFPELVIKDANGAVVYRCWYATFEHAILWVWRDFLLSTVVNAQDDTISKQAVSDIESVGLASKMMNRLEEEISAPPESSPPPKRRGYLDLEERYKRGNSADERRDLLLNAHHSPEMRAAIPVIKDLFERKKLSARGKSHPRGIV